MLQVDTEEQLRMVAALLGEDFDEWTIGEYPIRTLSLARPISFEEMGKVVDYIRAQGDGKVQQNKETTTMAEDRKLKSYMTSMQMEIVSDDDKTVKAIRIHGFQNEQMPVSLWCDLMQRFGKMTPGEEVMFVQNGKRATDV